MVIQFVVRGNVSGVSQFSCSIWLVHGSALRFRSSCASLAASSRKAAIPSSSSRLMASSSVSVLLGDTSSRSRYSSPNVVGCHQSHGLVWPPLFQLLCVCVLLVPPHTKLLSPYTPACVVSPGPCQVLLWWWRCFLLGPKWCRLYGASWHT